MAEVFQGTPVLTSVRIDGLDGKMVEYHVAGQDMDDVVNAVKKALSGLPSQEEIPRAVKTRKPRRTKAEMASDAVPAADTAWPK